MNCHTGSGYDPFKDFAPVAHVASFQLAFGIGPKVPAKTLAEYVALAKRGGPYTDFASPAAGSLPHFFGLLFARAVPYKGGAVPPTLREDVS
jgi:tripartite-type tricarboxylate transporter receptor subunit TctC